MGTDIAEADVVGKNEKDVRLLLLRERRHHAA